MSTPNLSQWYFSEEDLSVYTPSRLSGYSIEEEQAIRVKAVNFIYKIGASLKIIQISLSTASVLFHRFYMRTSLKDVHHYEVAAAALYLSCKSEECSRHIEDIAKQAIRICQKSGSIDAERDSIELKKWKAAIINTEEKILSVCCFDIEIEHPYEFLLNYFKDLENENLAHVAYAFVNDSFRTTLCLTHNPQLVAVIAIILASKFTKQQLPQNKSFGQEWWDFVGSNMKAIQDGGHKLLDLYERNISEPEQAPSLQ